MCRPNPVDARDADASAVVVSRRRDGSTPGFTGGLLRVGAVLRAEESHPKPQSQLASCFLRVPVDSVQDRPPIAATVSCMLITAAEAAEILGVQLQTVYDLASRGQLARHAPRHVRRAYDHAEIETRSLALLRRYHHPPHPYWATTDQAAVVLGMSTSNVQLMMLEDRLPYQIAANGRRYVRRPQLEVIANARETRLTEKAVPQLRVEMNQGSAIEWNPKQASTGIHSARRCSRPPTSQRESAESDRG